MLSEIFIWVAGGQHTASCLAVSLQLVFLLDQLYFSSSPIIFPYRESFTRAAGGQHTASCLAPDWPAPPFLLCESGITWGGIALQCTPPTVTTSRRLLHPMLCLTTKKLSWDCTLKGELRKLAFWSNIRAWGRECAQVTPQAPPQVSHCHPLGSQLSKESSWERRSGHCTLKLFSHQGQSQVDQGRYRVLQPASCHLGLPAFPFLFWAFAKLPLQTNKLTYAWNKRASNTTDRQKNTTKIKGKH